jgi:hypothetical protein
MIGGQQTRTEPQPGHCETNESLTGTKGEEHEVEQRNNKEFKTNSADSEASAIQPLSAAEVDQFVDRGFVLLKRAFSTAAAAAARDFLWRRLEADGITYDPDTWTRRTGIADVYTDDSSPWDQVITPRLSRAIDQLCGQGRTKSFGCGWWVVTYPGISTPPWGVDGTWHVDGSGYRHHVCSPEIGLLPIFIFNKLGPTDGGTVLSPGSHKEVTSLMYFQIDRSLKCLSMFRSRSNCGDRVIGVLMEAKFRSSLENF